MAINIHANTHVQANGGAIKRSEGQHGMSAALTLDELCELLNGCHYPLPHSQQSLAKAHYAVSNRKADSNLAINGIKQQKK